MTSRLCKDFITKLGITNQWILFENNLNKNTIYANRPIGNSPEVMPLESKLNKTCLRVLISYVQLQILLTILILSSSQRELWNKCCQLTHERGITPFCQKGTHQRKEPNKILIMLLTKRIFKYSTHGVILCLTSERDAVDGMNGQLFNNLMVIKWKKKIEKNWFTQMCRKRTKRRKEKCQN